MFNSLEQQQKRNRINAEIDRCGSGGARQRVWTVYFGRRLADNEMTGRAGKGGSGVLSCYAVMADRAIIEPTLAASVGAREKVLLAPG